MKYLKNYWYDLVKQIKIEISKIQKQHLFYDWSEKSIEILRRNGFKCTVRHDRFTENTYNLALSERHHSRVFSSSYLKYGITPKFYTSRGGTTTVEIICPTGKILLGKSFCSLEDNFNKKFGVKLALSRLQEVKI